MKPRHAGRWSGRNSKPLVGSPWVSGFTANRCTSRRGASFSPAALPNVFRRRFPTTSSTSAETCREVGCQAGRDWASASEGIRQTPQPQVRVFHQRHGNHRTRRIHSTRNHCSRISDTRRTVSALSDRKGFSSAVRDALLGPDFYRADKEARYYQRIAIDSAIRAIVGGQTRCLLTLATGTGKTMVAFQICWKLWSAKWSTTNDPTRKPRMLFLADRDKLVADPMSKDFAPFGDARHRIQGKAERGREMYFAALSSAVRR